MISSPIHASWRRGRSWLALARVASVLAVILALRVATPRALAAPPAPGTSAAPPSAPPAVNPLAATPWSLRRYGERVELTALSPVPATSVDPAANAGAQWLPLPLDLKEGSEFVTLPSDKLGGWDLLHVDLRLPAGLPPSTLIYVFIADWDDHWLQCLTSRPAGATGAVTLTVPISGPAATSRWTARDHYRPWHQTTGDQIHELGLKFAAPTGEVLDFHGTAMLTGLRRERLPASALPAPEVRNIHLEPATPTAGQRVELSFEVTHPYRDPFDRADVDLGATLVSPDGKETRLHAFYFEDFLFDENDPRATLVPYGFPQFRVRFTPSVPGTYTLRPGGSIHGATVTLPGTTFSVAPGAATWRGFIGKHPTDTRLLAYTLDHSEFHGIGLNVRSPYDTRYMDSFPFSAWQPYNLTMYHRLFPKYKAAGINVVEVWMSPWWFALEWMPDAPGNHGVGYYNPYRAWMLDKLQGWAEDNDINLILVFNNHGKYSTWCDADWGRNPYNKERGGTLTKPDEYFVDADAQRHTKQLLDYLIARWSFAPNLMAWKLFTEIDLTGSGNDAYHYNGTTEWHRMMANYLHANDPNHHLVATHWSTSYQKVNQPLARLPELDMLTLDIYYSSFGADKLYDMLQQTLDFADNMRKPAMITEFGGSPWADSLDHIHNQLELGLWGGWFGGMAMPPCFWWFPLVEEQNLYGRFHSLANFTAGEPRAGAVRVTRTLPEGPLLMMELRRGPQHRLGWLFDPGYFYAGDLRLTPRQFPVMSVPMDGLQAGDYVLEIWDCATGERRSSSTVTLPAGGPLQLPAFNKAVAFKLRPVHEPAAALPAEAPPPPPLPDGRRPGRRPRPGEVPPPPPAAVPLPVPAKPL